VRLPAWVQFIFQADLTHSHLKSIILHDTFGLLGEIAEIFLFTPKPEGFIIFHDHLEIPNINSMMSPQHHLILIKTPHYSSPPIREALAPDFIKDSSGHNGDTTWTGHGALHSDSSGH